jgi:hypothetical protein
MLDVQLLLVFPGGQQVVDPGGGGHAPIVTRIGINLK